MVPVGLEAPITMLLRRGIGNTETRKLFTDAFFSVGRFGPPKPTSASASHFGIVSMDGHQIGRPVRMHLLSADQTESSGRAKGGGEPAREFGGLVGAHRCRRGGSITADSSPSVGF